MFRVVITPTSGFGVQRNFLIDCFTETPGIWLIGWRRRPTSSSVYLLVRGFEPNRLMAQNTKALAQTRVSVFSEDPVSEPSSVRVSDPDGAPMPKEVEVAMSGAAQISAVSTPREAAQGPQDGEWPFLTMRSPADPSAGKNHTLEPSAKTILVPSGDQAG